MRMTGSRVLIKERLPAEVRPLSRAVGAPAALTGSTPVASAVSPAILRKSLRVIVPDIPLPPTVAFHGRSRRHEAAYSRLDPILVRTDTIHQRYNVSSVSNV